MENNLKNVPIYNSKSILKSIKFDDFYFNSINPIEECEYVYINANNLIKRSKKVSTLVIGELGFGVGLNFLTTLKALEKSFKNKFLHYISFEGYPLDVDQLKNIYLNFPELQKLSELLIKKLPMKMSGVHDIDFSEFNTHLTLVYDKFSSIKNFSFLADIWYLDGFSPNKNLSAWTEDIFKNIYKNTKHKGTLSTFTSATSVRKKLINAGFAVTKKKGFSNKREMLIGKKLQINNKMNINTSTLNIEPVAIIGGGITGASLAYSLKKRNIECFVIEKGSNLGNGASGNLIAFQMPKLTLDESIYGVFSLRSFLYSRNLAINLNSSPDTDGILVFPNRDRDLIKFKKLLHLNWPQNLFRNFEDKLFDNYNCVHLFSSSGILETSKFLKNLTKSVKLITNFNVCKIEHSTQNKILYDKEGKYLRAKTVIWCKGFENNINLPQLNIPTSGQVTYISEDIDFFDKKFNYSYGNYFSQAVKGVHQIGSTFSKDIHHRNKIYNELNIKNIPMFLRDNLSQNINIVGSRFSVRSSTSNRLPYFGSLFNNNEYFIGGMGSWGYTYAPFLSEVLVREILNEPKIIEKIILQKLNLENRI